MHTQFVFRSKPFADVLIKVFVGLLAVAENPALQGEFSVSHLNSHYLTSLRVSFLICKIEIVVRLLSKL